MEYYTAIGKKKEQPDGAFCVEIAGRPLLLSDTESFIWTVAAWTFAGKEEIQSRMERLLETVFGKGEKTVAAKDFSVYFQRLCTRGLLAAGKGRCYEEAAWEILMRSEMSVTRVPLSYKRKAFWYNIEKGYGLKNAIKAFVGIRLDREERQALAAVGQDGNAAEFLRKVDESEKKRVLKTLLSLYEKQQLAIRKIREA